jgi:hypothetical protein
MKSPIPALLALALLASAPTMAQTPPPDLPRRIYDEVVRAQNFGGYSEMLAGQAATRTNGELESALAAQLEKIRRLAPAPREESFNQLLRYYSTRHQAYKDSAVSLVDSSGYSWSQLVAGEYDSPRLARNLMAGMSSYMHDVIAPILDQVEAELARDFPDRNILFIGRDFTEAYFYTKEGDKLRDSRLFTLNVSRAIRDAVNAGHVAELRAILERLGLDKDRLLSRGLVLIDSSMKGLIPKAILRAALSDMSETEAYVFLSRADIRYIKSRSQGSQTLPQLVATAGASGRLSRAAIEQILAQDFAIQTFRLRIPAPRANWDADHLHNLFEHVPKPIESANRIAVDHQGQPYLDSPAPATPAARASTILGLTADLSLYQLRAPDAPRAGGHPVAGAAAEAKLKSIYREIDAAAKRGWAGMKAWQELPFPEAARAMPSMKVVDTGDPKLPYAVEMDGQRIYQLAKLVGEGRNIRAYLTSRGTILKVLKEADNARKQILQAWAEPVLNQYGIRVAHVLWADPNGLLLEQEYVPGESLEYDYAFDGGKRGMPAAITRQILKMWRQSIKLAAERDIWLDFKAANCHVNPNGEVVFVDFTPRLNNGFWRYFQVEKGGRALTEAEFLEEFLYRQVRDGKVFKTPSQDCERKLTR